MATLKKLGGRVCFHCPGCHENHCVPVGGDGWTFNGDFNRPTLTPSVLVNGHPEYHNPAVPRCHLFLTDGVIHFLADCGHGLAGQSVALKEIEP